MAVRSYIKNGKKHWRVILPLPRENGKQKQKWYTDKEWTTKRKAERGEARLLDELEAGTLKAPSNITVKAYLEFRLSKQKNKIEDTTYETYERFAEKISAFMGEMKLKDITRDTGKNIIEDLQDYLESKANNNGGGIAKNTI